MVGGRGNRHSLTSGSLSPRSAFDLSLDPIVILTAHPSWPGTAPFMSIVPG